MHVGPRTHFGYGATVRGSLEHPVRGRSRALEMTGKDEAVSAEAV
jgi:hypothetical protein